MKTKTMRAPSGCYPGESPREERILKIKYRATGEYRPPKKGEFYLSGAIIQAYRHVGSELETSYWIAAPVHMIQCPHCQGRGEIAGTPVL